MTNKNCKLKQLGMVTVSTIMLGGGLLPTDSRASEPNQINETNGVLSQNQQDAVREDMQK